MASSRKDWKRISAELSLMSPRRPNRSRDWTKLNWSELHCFTLHWCIALPKAPAALNWCISLPNISATLYSADVHHYQQRLAVLYSTDVHHYQQRFAVLYSTDVQHYKEHSLYYSPLTSAITKSIYYTVLMCDITKNWSSVRTAWMIPI